ncbi:MAG: Mth938-like domain-containing protein [Paracoccaceae bacterium]
MRLIEVTYAEAMPVEGYGPGFFRIAGRVLRGPSLISPWDAGAWGGLEDMATPLALTGRIDVLLLGMGADVAHAPKPFREAMEAAGIGVEVMATPAACRTYNVLLGEGRRIAAALIPIG